MKWEWREAWQQASVLMFGATAVQRHHQQFHRDLQRAYESFMDDVARTDANTEASSICDGVTHSPALPPRHRDHGFLDVRKHFQRIPQILSDLEFYFALTGLGLFDHLIGVLLLPLKALMHGRHCELRDVVTLLVLAACLCSFATAGLATTQLYSYLYHAVRRTSFIKLVMIFGILDVADKILSSLSQDSLEVLYACVDDEVAQHRHRTPQPTPASPGSAMAASAGAAAPVKRHEGTTLADMLRAEAEGEDSGLSGGADGVGRGEVSPTTRIPPPLPTAPPPRPSRTLLVGSCLAACGSTSLHSLCLLLHVVTLNVAINAEGNSLVALLIGNNFTELKSVVFKKNTPESLHSVCALDALERMQYVVFFLVMLLHHMHERFSDFAVADVIVILCVEVAIDFVKHVFVSKFNGIPPSVFRSFSQLALLDLSCETVLWRVPAVAVVSTDSSGRQTQVPEAAELLSPSCGFAPKHVKRAGFDAIAYAALLMWSAARVGGYMALHAPLVCGLLVVVLVLVKLMLSSVVYGVCARFTLRTLVLAPPRWPPSAPSLQSAEPQEASAQPPKSLAAVRRGRRGLYSAAAPSADVASWGVRLGVSPISTPCTTPIASGGRAKPPASPPADAARTMIRLTPLLLALLKVDRFDLQAGKAKRVY